MPANPAGIVLTYGGTDIQDIEGIFLEMIEGGPGTPALIRGSDDIIPSKDGRSARNRRKDHRVIELAGFIMGVGVDIDAQTSDFDTNVLTLGTIFDCTARATLQATLRNGQVWTIEAIPLPDSFQYRQAAAMYCTVSLALESIDPDWVLSGS